MSVPSEVLAQYQSVNNRANATANTPFQTYNTSGTATSADYANGNTGTFVAPVNQTQQTGIAGTTAAANEAQPAYSQAIAGTEANSAPISGQQINQYMSPYLQDVVGSESQLLNQNNQQQQAGQLGTAISSGAFGGDRTGIAAANLEQQQNLSNANIYSGLLNQGYNTALSTAQQEQQVGLAGANQLGSLGAGAQSAALQGAGAEIQAGTVEQQTQQAQDTAQYNQFEQQQSYPFQVDQFLAGIAEGTGALSGSTTTTQQPGGFFSDERLKEDKKPIGKTYDGQTIYSYKMKGDPRTRIGLMAQEVDKKHPEAVGLAAGFKTVDYDKATRKAANEGHFYTGGVVPLPKASGGLAGRMGYDEGGQAGDINSVLEMQRAMYGANGGQHNVVGNSSNQSHQLAVASGSPPPAPSGASKLQQSMSLGNQGYQIYNKINPSTPSSGVGVSGNDPQFLQQGQDAVINGQVSGASSPVAAPGGLSTAAPTADASTAGLAPSVGADAGADAAGTAATSAAADAAASAGTDAAVAGATDAAAAGATDAAATEAAALAAEYAVGDAAVAALAAKRGGAIRKGLAGGGGPYEGDPAGDPYSDDGGSMDIPDDPNTNKLKTAGALVKQPTGLQTLSMMANPQEAQTIGGSMFSNQALYRGGLARRHFDVGGDVDPDIAAGLTVEAQKPDPVTYDGGVSAPPTTNYISTPSADIPKDEPKAEDGPSWWDRNKGNVIPAIAALGAMGTAPTRSWGTALAAGLAGGANAYVPTQEGLANASLTQQKAREAGYQADLQQAANNAAIPMLNNAASSRASLPTVSSPQSNNAPNAPVPLATQLRQKYQNPPITQDEAQKIQQASILSAATKNPQWLESAKLLPQQRTAATDYANKQDARENYDNAVETWRATKDTNPSVAASAAATADAYQQYTGDEPKVENGVQLNGRTMEPYIGTQAQRLSPEAYTHMAEQLTQKVDVPAGDPSDPGKTIQIPTYKKMGFNRVADAIAALVPKGTPDVPGQTSQATAPTTQKSISQPQRSPVAPVAQSTQPQKSAVPSQAAAILPKPVAEKAFTDPKFFPPKPANQLGTSFGASTSIDAKAWADRKVLLQQVASETSENAGAALQYADAAQKILDSKGAPVTGFFGPLAKQISSIAGTANASNYEEVSKQLINLAVQAGKSNFPNATQKEVGIQLEQASPSTNQQGPALRSLLDETKRINQYAIDTSHLATDYLDKGGNPLRFGEWNLQYHPRAEAVNRTIVKTGTYNGRKVTQYSDGKIEYAD